jgi:hypothetical protein
MIRAHMRAEFNREKANAPVGTPTHRDRIQPHERSKLTDRFHFDLPDSMSYRK